MYEPVIQQMLKVGGHKALEWEQETLGRAPHLCGPFLSPLS